MGANGYSVQVHHCPDDRNLGYPRFKAFSQFVGVDFMDSLYGGVFPNYMIVRFLGAPFHAPDADGTLWTVGPHPTREGKQALYEYDGERVLASKPRKPSTLIDITEEIVETKYYTMLVEVVIEAKSEEGANSVLRDVLSDCPGTADGTLIDWDAIEEEA